MINEITQWKVQYLNIPKESRPKFLASAMKECDKDIFRNIVVLLKIASVFPVTSCECERSASALRRLNMYMQASMGQDRLSISAILYILE